MLSAPPDTAMPRRGAGWNGSSAAIAAVKAAPGSASPVRATQGAEAVKGASAAARALPGRRDAIPQIDARLWKLNTQPD